jgi:hypothetical protein
LLVLKAASTPFCLGSNDRGWRVTFDWLIENDKNISKLLEGNYDGQPNGPFWKEQQKLEEERNADSVRRFMELN